MTDREKAIEILQRLADGKAEELNIFDDEGGGVCGQILEEQDAILAGIEALKEQRPHGKWIPKAVHNCWSRFKCSVCGYYHEPVHAFGESKPDFNFCPKCGASMVKEGEAVSRKNENDTMVKNLSTSFKGTSEEGKLFLLGNISAILIDISKSLAVIADKLEKEGGAK